MSAEFDEHGRPYLKCEKLTADGSDKKTFDYDLVNCTKEESNLVGSLLLNGNHRPVLDLDFDCQLIPSSTEGHYHLYINKEVEPARWEELVIALRNANILQPGFADGSIRCKQNTVRPPWIKKENKQ